MVTSTAAIQLHPHGNMTVPGPGVESYEPSADWWPETVCNYQLSLGVSSEDLREEKRVKRTEKLSNTEGAASKPS